MSGWSHSSFRFQPQSVVELRRDELDSSWKRSSSLVLFTERYIKAQLESASGICVQINYRGQSVGSG